MSIQSLLIRFTCIYIVLLIVAAVIFNLLKLKSNSGANMGALIGAVFATCYWFFSSSKRYFTSEEKKRAITGMCLINVFVQTVAAIAMGKASGISLPYDALLLGIIVVGLIQSIGIYFFVTLLGKQLHNRT